MAYAVQWLALLFVCTWGQPTVPQCYHGACCSGGDSNTELTLVQRRMAELEARQAQLEARQAQLEVKPTEDGGRCAEPQPTCSWEMVFRIVSNVSQDSFPVWDAATTPSSMPEDPRLAGNGHYRSMDLDVWESLNIKQVKLSLYTFGQQDETRDLIFNGVGSDKNNWFSQDRLISSPWTDLKTANTNLGGYYFSIAGHVRHDSPQRWLKRRFFINRSYASHCNNDFGWLVVLDEYSNVCEWERRVATSNPSILYSKRSTHLNYHRDWADVGIADAMAIFIKTCED